MRSFLLVVTLLAAGVTKAQKVDSIYFNLYTDSLKKGTHNYINVDGKLSNGRWLPMTAKEIVFSASSGSFDGNSLCLDKNTTVDKVTVKAVLKADTAVVKEITIYIKKSPDNERLKTAEEVMQPTPRRKNHS
jgi:hypothetical protein